MSDTLQPSTALVTTEVDIALEPLPAEQVVADLVSTGLAELGSLGGVEFGLWEHTAGTSTDVEADEVFVVVAGRGRVEIAGSGGGDPVVILLAPGTVARLAAGSRTTWFVEEPLRKVWFAV